MGVLSDLVKRGEDRTSDVEKVRDDLERCRRSSLSGPGG
jgi:hypothetical protein